jgi:hypothetical protein
VFWINSCQQPSPRSWAKLILLMTKMITFATDYSRLVSQHFKTFMYK